LFESPALQIFRSLGFSHSVKIPAQTRFHVLCIR
jgi:hypothetical protein